MRKDKVKVVDEVWNDDRIRRFLDRAPPLGVNGDFHALLMAYQSMRADDFARFVGFFTEAGRDLNARSPDGQTVAEVIATHRHAQPFLAALGADTTSEASA